MSGSGDFLSRWSRLKRQAKQPDASEVPAPAPEQDAAVAPSAGVHEPETPGETEPPPDLPDPGDLTAQSDCSAFLREGIPERLRNAALRRMWSLDPSIRDFVGDARDYAYDWNTPGGVPGFGPILPGDDVKAMVAAIFGSSQRPQPQPEAPPAPQLGEESDSASVPVPEDSESSGGSEFGLQSEAALAQEETAGGGATLASPASLGSSSSDPIRAVHDVGSPTPEARSRRHGGAKPV